MTVQTRITLVYVACASAFPLIAVGGGAALLGTVLLVVAGSCRPPFGGTATRLEASLMVAVLIVSLLLLFFVGGVYGDIGAVVCGILLCGYGRHIDLRHARSILSAQQV
jgi:hypothetical protein